MEKQNIAIITSGFLPVPATKGGAVENLVVNILKENEKEKKEKFTIFSIFDEQAIEESIKYSYSEFVFIKPPLLVKFLDKIIYFVSKKILRKKNSQSYRYIIQRLFYLNSVSKNLKKDNYKKILLENHPTQYLALKWRKNNIKYANRYYYHCHNEFPSNYGCYNIISKTEKFICVSEYIKRELSTYLNLNKTNFDVLRNCIDEKLFTTPLNDSERIKIRMKYGISKKDKIIIFTGRIVPEKGVLELINCINNVTYSNFKLLIVGSSLNELNVKTEYEEKVEKALKKIKEKVIFTGFIKYEEINKLYSISDLAVIPSVWNDPAPLTIIESLTCGLPIITTESGGIPEYVNDKCAIILKRDDNLVNTLSSSIDNILKDNVARNEMSKESKILSKYLTINNYYKNFINILKK